MRKILNTPLKFAIAVTPLTVGISVVLEWLLTRLVTMTTVVIAAPVTFIMAYLVTSTMFRYQRLLNHKNRQLKKVTEELQETNATISKQNIEGIETIPTTREQAIVENAVEALGKVTMPESLVLLLDKLEELAEMLTDAPRIIGEPKLEIGMDYVIIR